MVSGCLKRLLYDFAPSKLTFNKLEAQPSQGQLQCLPWKHNFTLWAMCYSRFVTTGRAESYGKRAVCLRNNNWFYSLPCLLQNVLVGFLLIMFRIAFNTCCAFERRKENHFKEELSSFDKILPGWNWAHNSLKARKSTGCYRNIEQLEWMFLGR